MEALSGFWTTLGEQPNLRGVVIIVLCALSAWFVDFFCTRVILAMTSRTRTTIDDSVVELLHGPVRITVVLFGLALGAREMTWIGPGQLGFVINALKTIGAIVWFSLFMKMSDLLLGLASGSSGRRRIFDPRMLPLFSNTVRVVLTSVFIYAVFLFWKIDVTAWLASAGIVGIAVGFAAKDTIANLFGGVFILTDGPYKVGDYVNLDSGERGQVTHIGIRTTRILTRDDLEVTVPNSVMANATISNESGGRWPRSRIRVKVGVAYGSDVDQLRALLMDVAAQNELVCGDPEPRVRFRSFGDSSLDFELLGWIDDPETRGRVVDALLTTIYKRLGEEGIEIPYPKRDVYLHQVGTVTKEE